MKFISIKWKLGLSFVLISLGMVGIYVLIAKQTFETDKISYVFDSQQREVEYLAKEAGQKIERVLFEVRSLLTTRDVSLPTLPPAAQSLFLEQKLILAFQIWDVEKNQSLFKVEKLSGQLLDPNPNEFKLTTTQPKIFHYMKETFLLVLEEKISPTETRRFRILMDFSNFFNKTQSNQTILLTNEYKTLLRSDIGNLIVKDNLQEIILDSAKDHTSKTFIRNILLNKYLISTAPISFGNLQIISVIPEKTALGALQVLYKKSVAFILFSVFATVLISFFLASGLTQNLKYITEAAEKIGKGQFNQKITVSSRDEIGVLSKAFQKMGSEISRLLLETKDKARMESELKTTRLVQESLLPHRPTFITHSLSLSGIYATSTECGGDWWYYYEQEEELYIAIADATGHGTPSALITAAARALFSKIETQKMNLIEIAKDWDFAIASCSNKKVFMTALLLKINTRTGKGKMLNASHEPPVLIKSAEDKLQAEFLLLSKGATLGENGVANWIEQDFTLEPGERLFLYTDGMTAVENSEGKTIGEKRILNSIVKKAKEHNTAEDLVNGIYDIFEKHRAGINLPDDITMVVLQRT